MRDFRKLDICRNGIEIVKLGYGCLKNYRLKKNLVYEVKLPELL
jgi:hypothetical protein